MQQTYISLWYFSVISSTVSDFCSCLRLSIISLDCPLLSPIVSHISDWNSLSPIVSDCRCLRLLLIVVRVSYYRSLSAIVAHVSLLSPIVSDYRSLSPIVAYISLSSLIVTDCRLCLPIIAYVSLSSLIVFDCHSCLRFGTHCLRLSLMFAQLNRPLKELPSS